MNKNMFKYNSKVLGSIFLIVFMAGLFLIAIENKQEQLQNKMVVFGAFFEETDADKVINKIGREDIYAIGKNTIITKTQIKKYQEFYNHLDANIAREKAIQYAKERNALYVAAIQNGYDVSDEEVWNYIKQMQNEYMEFDTQNNNNYNMPKDSNFDSCKIDVSIQKYVKDMEKTSSVSFEDYKKGLVAKQEYKVAN